MTLSADAVASDPGGYAVSGQYYDLVSFASMRESARSALAELVPGRRHVVEIGAGTGWFTAEIVELLETAGGDGEVSAIEPNPIMRVPLAARLTALPVAERRATIVAGDALADVAGPIDLVVVLNTLGHLSPTDRTACWAHWAARAAPGAAVLVTAHRPEVATDVAPIFMPGRRLGRHHYTAESRASVLDDERLMWTMTYRTFPAEDPDGPPLREETVSAEAWIVPDATLDRELAVHGGTRIPGLPDGVLGWRLP
jgi:SAM-dependent methyltransferase